MLLLTSPNDRLQVITGSAVPIDVHASWVDTSAGTITPGRTNTAITTVTTTSVAGAPAASTQRNVKTLHVRNKHATLSCDVTVQHTDGTIVAQLYKATLDAGQMLMYTDQAGFGGGRVAPVVGGIGPKLRVFAASATYTPTAGMISCIIECVGGGGGGGGAVAIAAIIEGGGGGGSGGYSRVLKTAAEIGASQGVTVGAAGVGALGVDGTAGGDSYVGTSYAASLCGAKGGLGGVRSSSAISPASGAGGAPGIGLVTAGGSPGGAGQRGSGDVYIGSNGSGASSYFGGGGLGANVPSTILNGGNASNYGSGGGGGAAYNSGSASGGNGSAGVVIITEYF